MSVFVRIRMHDVFLMGVYLFRSFRDSMSRVGSGRVGSGRVGSVRFGSRGVLGRVAEFAFTSSINYGFRSAYSSF